MSKPDCIRDDYADRLMLGKDNQKDACDLYPTFLLITTTNPCQSRNLKVRSPTTPLIPLRPACMSLSRNPHLNEKKVHDTTAIPGIRHRWTCIFHILLVTLGAKATVFQELFATAYRDSSAGLRTFVVLAHREEIPPSSTRGQQRCPQRKRTARVQKRNPKFLAWHNRKRRSRMYPLSQQFPFGGKERAIDTMERAPTHEPGSISALARDYLHGGQIREFVPDNVLEDRVRCRNVRTC